MSKNESLGTRPEPSAVAALYSPNAHLTHPFDDGPNASIRGRDALIAYFESLTSRVKTLTHVETRLTIVDDRAIWEGRVQGVMAENDKAFDVPAVFVIEFDETGKVADQQSYLSFAQVYARAQ